MNDALKMQVSAFVDGELPTSEAELLTRRLGQDPALRREAARFMAIGRVMRGEQSVPGVAELHKRIASELEQEPAIGLENAAGSAPRWLRPAAGVAIAASVALLALAGLRQLDLPEVGGTAPDGASLIVDERDAYTQPLAIDVMADRPGDMLMQYYLSHGETSGELGANGILSRLVTLELRGGELVEITPATDSELEPTAADDDNNSPASAQDP